MNEKLKEMTEVIENTTENVQRRIHDSFKSESTAQFMRKIHIIFYGLLVIQKKHNTLMTDNQKVIIEGLKCNIIQAALCYLNEDADYKNIISVSSKPNFFKVFIAYSSLL